MKQNSLLRIEIKPLSKNDILEQIKKYISYPDSFIHIISLNPENLVEADKNLNFKEIITKAQIKINDGIGVVLAGRLLGYQMQRISGVDLMEKLIKLADNQRLRVMLIGGKGNLALKVAKRYNQTHAQAKFQGVEGIKNITKPSVNEENKVFSIVADYKPHLLFVAFGSPFQEMWLNQHRERLKGIICMGVGGGFDYLSGNVRRAPQFIRSMGFEWLFRLFLQPWRWRRQLHLLHFIWLVLLEKFKSSVDK